MDALRCNLPQLAADVGVSLDLSKTTLVVVLVSVVLDGEMWLFMNHAPPLSRGSFID